MQERLDTSEKVASVYKAEMELLRGQLLQAHADGLISLDDDVKSSEVFTTIDTSTSASEELSKLQKVSALGLTITWQVLAAVTEELDKRTATVDEMTRHIGELQHENSVLKERHGMCSIYVYCHHDFKCQCFIMMKLNN